MRNRLLVWWYRKTTFEKVAFWLRIAMVVLYLTAFVLSVTNVWDGLELIFPLCVSMLYLISAYEDWDERRGWAIFELCWAGLFALALTWELYEFISHVLFIMR